MSLQYLNKYSNIMGNDVVTNCKNACDGMDDISRDRLREMRSNKLMNNNTKKCRQEELDIHQIIANYIEDSPLIKKPTVIFPSGSTYDGQWKCNTITGTGILKICNKEGEYVYEGEFLCNKPHNKGKAVYINGSSYEGEWVDGVASGFGIFTHKDGATYEGYWYNNMQNGQGIQKWPDNSKYQGNFKDGMKHGKGRYSWADGNFYEGSWYCNIIEGEGRYQWANGRVYEGNWTEGKMNGFGVHIWQDGRKYQGEYKNDKKHGAGKYYWPDGRIFEGVWRDGKREGKGSMIINGNKKVGEWKNDERVRWIQEEKPTRNNLTSIINNHKQNKQ